MGNITARTDVRDGVLDGAENGNGDEILLRRVMDVGGDGSAPRVEVMGDIPFKIIDLKPRRESADQESSLFFGNGHSNIVSRWRRRLAHGRRIRCMRRTVIGILASEGPSGTANIITVRRKHARYRVPTV